MDAEVHRDIEDAGALREVHAEEEDIAPRRMRQVHAHGSAFAQDGEGAVSSGGEQFRAEAQGLVLGVAHAEHPLISPHRPDTAAHLVGQSLESEAVIGGGEGTAQGIAGALLRLSSQEGIDGFLKTAVEELLVALEGDVAAGFQFRPGGQVEAVDGSEEKEGADAVVEVVAITPEGIENGSLLQEPGKRQGVAMGIEGLIADLRVRRSDEVEQAGVHGLSGIWWRGVPRCCAGPRRGRCRRGRGRAGH